MNFDWLQICAEGQTTACIPPVQLAYLVALHRRGRPVRRHRAAGRATSRRPS